MPLPPHDAADALRHIHAAEKRSATAFHYQAAAPHLFIWGAIWVVGYAGIYRWPHAWPLWPVLVVLGTVASWRVGSRFAKPAYRWRYGATVVALVAFVAAIFAVLPPQSSAQINALFPILVALGYGLLGIWSGAARLALLGAALGALTLAGYFWLPQWFLLWMAALGGGALILGGFWLRRI